MQLGISYYFCCPIYDVGSLCLEFNEKQLKRPAQQSEEATQKRIYCFVNSVGFRCSRIWE